MEKIKVLVADGETLYRESICALLKDQQDIKIVGQASDSRKVIEKVRKHAPDVVLMEVAKDQRNDEDIIPLLCNGHGNVKVLLVSQYEDEEHILSGLRSGCHGYIPKRATASELVSAIHAVYRGGYFLYPSVAKIVINECVRRLGEEQLTLRATLDEGSADLSAHYL